jgi:hypothetical protein
VKMAHRIIYVLLVPVAAVGITCNLPAQQETVAQTAKDRAPVTADTNHRQHIVARHKWQSAGRRVLGANSAALRARAVQQTLQMRAARSVNAPANTSAWISLGPKPLPSDASGTGLQDYGFVSGRTTAVAIDPNDPSGNTVFAGGAYAGLWKSTNAGTLSPNPASVSWVSLTDTQATLAIGSIAVQPQLSNPNPAASVVLAGTGETDSSADSYYGLGILRSADGGQTWTLITQDATGAHPFAGLGFSHIAFSTANSSLVVAAAGSASEGILDGLENPAAVNRGLYYSTNAGTSWRAANVSDSGASVTSASVTAVVYNAAASTFYAAIRFHGFYSSPDGTNWTRLAIQPGTELTASVCPAQAASPSNCPIYRGEIAVVPNRPGPNNMGEMYAWYVDANEVDQGIWQSIDGGVSWIQINDSGITNCGDLFGGCGTAQGAFALTLAAVPNGDTITDLYAGAVNIYKCRITNTFPTCNGPEKSTFLNLTHVYGCSDIAKVHPNQHAMDFLIANGTALLYFANDGGVYRALDGYTGLTTGSCGLTNQFDSLNQTLGPMTQFVSISQSSTDANLIFGGTQDNGAPATAFSQSMGPWVNVNAGENGFTAINPANENEWFLASPPNSASGVNLFRCANGVNCHSLDFQNDQFADSNALGGDTGPFYLPFLLDPQDSSELILGTCRIWRGTTIGGNFSLLSPDFETGGTGSCSGNEINLVRSIAAGGPKDANGLSQVIYAGTSGEGPLIATTPIGGHIWVTTNADAGPFAWNDVTHAINPQGFPISSITLDSADPLGNTAYVTIMGFHTSHVWKTSNAGTSWTDFTANLPDAPTNFVIVDSGTSPSNGTVYVGTDVGVFASSTGTAAWTEVGPALGQGSLPNVAVTSVQIFKSGGLKRLRAATYGRGIWEWNLVTTPDFQINVSNNPSTIFPGQVAVFNGVIFALNGYNSRVNLSCTAGGTSPPQNCAAIPASILPTANGANLAINTSGSTGDYAFNLHAVGTDPTTVTHDFSVNLHIVDFTLSTPAPNSVRVTPGNTSPVISLSVSANGSFSSAVSLSCSNLPTGTSCQFQPSSSMSPTSGNPVSVELIITTLATSPPGTSSVTINAKAAGAPAKTQPLTLTIGNIPDYTLSITNPSLIASVNSSAQFEGTLRALNGYVSTVALSCGTDAPPICTVSPASAVPSIAGTPFLVTVSSNVSQGYPFNITGVGNDSATITHAATVTFITTPSQSFEFTMEITPASASVPVGQPTILTLNVNPTAGSFPKNVNFSCSKLPALTTCGFNPSQVSSGSENSDVTFTIATTAPVPASRVSMLATFLSAFPVAGLICLKRRKRPFKIPRWSILTLLLVPIFGLLSCGGGLQGNGGGSGSPGTPPGTYTITVTATCGSVTHTAQVLLTVTP